MLDPDPVARTRDGFRIAARTQVPSGVRMQRDGRLLIARGAVVEGGVYLAGSLYTEPHVRVHGPVKARGRIILGAACVVAGAVESDADVRLLPGTVVHGDLRAVGDVHLFDGAVVKGTVTSGGDIVVWGGAETGRLKPAGKVRTEAFPRPTAVKAETSGPRS